MRALVAALSLALIATCVPELLTGSTPLLAFAKPLTLFFLFLGYGVAVVSVRELAVRWNLTFLGIFILGLAYGIFNEGLMARTMLLQDGIPIPQLNDYGYLFGISFPWAVFITLWHAVCSVLFPILASYALFPDMRTVPWLGKKMFVSSFLSSGILIALVFVGTPKVLLVQGPLLALLVSICALIFFARRFKNKQVAAPSFEATPALVPETFNIKPLLFGLCSAILFYLVLIFLIASLKLPSVLFFVALGGGVVLVLYIVRKNMWAQPRPLLLFTVGCYIVTTLIGILALI